MNRYGMLIGFITVMLMIVCVIPSLAEKPSAEAEQGLDEIQPLLEMTDEKEEKEGMSLEEMTEAFSDSAMSEYLDSSTGFSMQYPSVFLFDEELSGNTAATADGKAKLSIDNMENRSGLDEEALKAAILLEIPGAVFQKNIQNGCLRIDRLTDGGMTGQTDLYLLTEHSFHHVMICYPSSEQGTYFAYIEYMINTMETNETDLG